MKKKKVHYKYFYQYALAVRYFTRRMGEWYVACDNFLVGGLPTTRVKSKVTCKNCRRTKRFRGIK